MWQRIADFMQKTGKTWADTAKTLDVSTAAMAQWKSGKTRISNRILRRLDEAERAAGIESWHRPDPSWGPLVKLRHYQNQSGKDWKAMAAFFGMTEAEMENVLSGRRALTAREVEYLEAISQARDAADRIGPLPPEVPMIGKPSAPVFQSLEKSAPEVSNDWKNFRADFQRLEKKLDRLLALLEKGKRKR